GWRFREPAFAHLFSMHRSKFKFCRTNLSGEVEEQLRQLKLARETIRSESATIDDLRNASHTILSICRLSTLLCEHAIKNDCLSGMLNQLMRTSSRKTDRNHNPTAESQQRTEDIVECGTQAIEEMLKCSTARTRDHLETCMWSTPVTCIANRMIEAHHNPVITTSCMRIIRICKEIVPVERHFMTFKAIPGILNSKEHVFANLASDDVRRKEFLKLQKAFPLPEQLLIAVRNKDKYHRDLIIAKFMPAQLVELCDSLTWNLLSPETSRAILKHCCQLANP
ncbi:hypothetical protein PMAYCL1PPCAC_14101, partial [Pristionchus mayeri]